MGPESSITRNIRIFSEWIFFIFKAQKILSWNKRSFFIKFYFPKYNKNICLRKYKNFFNLRVRRFHFPKYKKILKKYMYIRTFFRVDFFYFFSLGLRVTQIALELTTAMISFWSLNDLKSLINQPACCKNPDKPICIDLILTNHL